MASGSEYNHVYMWKRSSGKLVSTMEGHGGIVSAIAWNSVDGVLATGSDEKGVRVWGDPKGKGKGVDRKRFVESPWTRLT